MGFLDRLKKDSEADIREDWKILDDEQKLQQLLLDSHKKTVGIFKHSTRCGISTRAKYVLENDWEYKPEELDFYYLDLLQHRDISNKVAELTGVQHQSPQVILLKEGEPVYEETHHEINAAELREYL